MNSAIEEELHKKLQDFSKKLPHFKDGRIDYTHAKTSPAVLCFVMHQGRLLLVKRSDKVLAYGGKWHGIGGFLDDPQKSLMQKIHEELNEELGVQEKDIDHVVTGKMLRVDDPFLKRTWELCLALVELKTKPPIRLDWEHTAYRWISPEELSSYDTVPGLSNAFAEAQKMKK